MEETIIKGVKISEEVEPPTTEEIVSLAGASKVKFSVDKYKDKICTGFRNLSPKPELPAPDHEPLLAIQEEKMEDDGKRGTQQCNNESPFSDKSSAANSNPPHSVEEEGSKMLNKGKERRSTIEEFRGILKIPSLRPIRVQPSTGERSIEPKLTEITSLSAASVKSIFSDSSKRTLSQQHHYKKLHAVADDCQTKLPRSRTSSACKPFRCNECNKRFAQNCDLRKHLRTHTGEKPFQCDECKQRFTQSITLKLHLRIHTGEKPYQCEVCERRFRLRCDLKKHRMIHTEERPFHCEKCELRFRLRNDLEIHRKVHAGEKLFQCGKCPKQFTQSGSLTVHKRVHSGEKPFKCRECPQAFPRSHDLKRHRRIHSGEKPFQCGECDLRFSQSNSLKRHQRVHSEKEAVPM